jgi:hypothetical protein
VAVMVSATTPKPIPPTIISVLDRALKKVCIPVF